MTKQQQKTIDHAAMSPMVNASNIQTLTVRIDALGQSVDFWNVGMLWALVFTALAAVAVVVTTRMVLTRSKQLADTQSALIAAKDSQLALELKGKDEQIAGLNVKAHEAEAGISAAQIDAGNATKNAANAVAAQQRVQIELAKQQERAANAEKDLAQLRLAIRPRRLSHEQQTALVGLLTGDPKGTVSITCVMGDGEGNAFALDVDSVLTAAGWTVTGGGVSQSAYSGGDPSGFGIVVHSALTAPPYAGRLQRAFFSVGIPLGGIEVPGVPEGSVQIIVGHKPTTLQ